MLSNDWNCCGSFGGDSQLGCPAETCFDLKQLKLEPKLVSALSEAKRLFRLFRFYTETVSFGDSIEPKQTEVNSLIDFSEKLGLFRFALVCYETVCFGCFASMSKQRVLMFRLNLNKQKTNRNSLIESIFWYFSENLVLFRNSSVYFSCFNISSKHRNKLKQT